MLLTNMLNFVELGAGVRLYNEELERITKLREDLRAKKEEMKERFTENQQLVTDIQQLNEQIDHADKKIKELQHEYQLLEKSDVMLQNEKKHKASEIYKIKSLIQDL
jgi:septal ring factor EnvC (AmiA/AmiB activator)